MGEVEEGLEAEEARAAELTKKSRIRPTKSKKNTKTLELAEAEEEIELDKELGPGDEGNDEPEIVEWEAELAKDHAHETSDRAAHTRRNRPSSWRMPPRAPAT